jgi:hypothetical protein
MQARHAGDGSERVLGEPFTGATRSPRTYRPDRVCAAPGCATRLSIYNGTAVCASHNAHRARPPGSEAPADDAIRAQAS